MATIIAKIDDRYLYWSTIVDAPVTYLMTAEEAREHHRRRYGSTSMDRYTQMIACADQKGVSGLWNDSIYEDVQDLIRNNRAGPEESELTLDEIKKKYTRALSGESS